MIDIYKSTVMVSAISLMPPRTSFLRDRYFPITDSPIASDGTFPTEEVLVEYEDEMGNVMAPVVVPMANGVEVKRKGYKTDKIIPPYVKPKRGLTADELSKKGYGEAPLSGITAEQRQANILNKDLQELGQTIDTREEYMASKLLTENGYVMREYTGEYGGEKYKEYTLKFYDGEDNSSEYIVAEKWTADTPVANIFADIDAMCEMLTSRGVPVTDLLPGYKVAQTLLSNNEIKDILNNRRMEMLSVKPEELTPGVSLLGSLVTPMGNTLTIILDNETYVGEDKKNYRFIPENRIVLTAPACGRRAYGAVTLLEGDDNFHTYQNPVVPQVLSDRGKGLRELVIHSRPLLLPKVKSPWISSEVV